MRHRSSDPLEGARSSLQKIRAAKDWDEATPVVHVSVQQPPAAKRTPAPPPPPGTLQIIVQGVGGLFERFPKWGGVLVAVVAILAYVYLATHGRAPAPPVP